MKMISRLACVINSIAAINWGIVAFKGLEYNLVTMFHNLFGIAYIDQCLYILFTLSGLYMLVVSIIPGCGRMCD